MNVLLVVPWDNLGGVSAVVNRVAHHLRDHGHAVWYMIPGDQTRAEPYRSRCGFPGFRMNLRPTVVDGAALRSRIAFAVYLPLTLVLLALLLRRHRIDVVNVHYPGSPAIYFAILTRLGLIRLVTSIHGADLLPNGARPPSRQLGVRALVAASHAVVSPSDSYRDAVRAAWPEFARRHIETIPNGVDTEELASHGDVTVTAGEPYVLSIVQLVRYKGVDVLIQAFAGIAPQHPGLRLKLISDGPDRAEFLARAEQLGVADRVDFLGFLERPQVVAYLRGCTLFCLPSRSNSESFGIAAAEAMAMARPVIASRVGGLPELIRDNVTGLLVPPGDVPALTTAMQRILRDPAMGLRLGRSAGRSVRRRFLWERTGALYEATMRRVLEAPTRWPAPADVVLPANVSYSGGFDVPARRRERPRPSLR